MTLHINVKPKVAYVLGAKFPTSKAYGITARETLKVLRDNNFETKIFCQKSKYYDQDFKDTQILIEYFSNSILAKLLIIFGERGTNVIYQTSWQLGTTLSVLKNIGKIVKFNADIIWVRDPIIALISLISNSKSQIFLEVHQESKKFLYRKLIRYSSRIKFFPINQENSKFLLNISKSFNIKLAPMGIRQENIVSKTDCQKLVKSIKIRRHQNIRIAYVGKFSPGGYSKGIEDLIYLAQNYSVRGSNFSVTLVGAMRKELDYYQALAKKLKIRPKNLKIKPYVRHSQVLKLLKNFDVLILPEYSNSNYNGMPIKLLEYVSSGRITIVANTKLYQSIFTSKYRPFFYESGSIKSLDQAISSAISANNLEKKLVQGLEFSHNFTWNNRVLKMIQ
jgi:glycosyltransferase involved in cell wall biosynthesis